MSLRRLLTTTILSVLPAIAHHTWAGFADFDTTKTVRLSGAISNVEFVNPHVLIYLDVKNANGSVTIWMVEAPPPAALVRMGVTKTQLAEGSNLTLDTYLAKDGSPKANGRGMILPDGRQLAISSAFSK